MARWVSAVAGRPRLVLALFVLLAGAGLWHAVANIQVDTEASNMIDRSLRYRQKSEEYLALFGQSKSSVAVLVRADTLEQADEVAQALVARMRTRPDRFAQIYAPAVDPFLRTHGLLFLDEESFYATVRRLSEAAPFLERMAKDPSLKGLFGPLKGALENEFEASVFTNLMRQLGDTAESVAAGDPKPMSWAEVFRPREPGMPVQRVITVIPQEDFASLTPAREVVATIRDLAAEVRAETGIAAQLYITGDAALRSEELSSVVQGIWISLVLSILFVAAVLTYGLRAWQLVTGALLALFMGLFLTLGFASLAVGSWNLVSIAFAVLFVGLGIDFAIHFALGYREAREGGLAHRPALKGAVGEIGLALGLCAPTTALTFYAFVPTKFVGMAQLGIISGTGVFIAFFTAVTFIPAWLSLFPPKLAGKKRLTRPDGAPDRARAFRAVSRPVALIGLVAGLVAIPALTQVRFDANPMNLRNPASPSVQAFNLLFEDDRTQPYTLEFVADDLVQAEALAARFKALPEVARTVTLASFVPKQQDEKLPELDFLAGELTFVFLAEPEPTQDLAEKRSAVANFLQVLRTLERDAYDAPFLAQADRLRAVLPDILADPAAVAAYETALFTHLGDLLSQLERQVAVGAVTLADVPDSIRSRYLAEDGRARIQLYPQEDIRDDAARARFVNAATDLQIDVTGSALTVLYAGRYVSQSMLQATLTAAVGAALMIFLAVRSIGTTLLILLPLALAAVLTLAMSVWLGMPFNFANVIVLPLLIGLGVDSGIHFVLRARQGGNPFEVINTATPRAVLLSALTTIGSFGTLALNDHRGTASMGALLTIAITLTLICTLVVLPGFWSLTERWSNRRRAVPDAP